MTSKSVLLPKRTLAVPIPVLVAPPNNAVKAPHQTRHKQTRRRHPRQNQELIPLLRTDPDPLALIVDNIRRLDRNSSGDSGRNTHSQESDQVNDNIRESAQAAREEDADERGDESEAGEGDADAVEDEHGVAGDFERGDGVVDFVGPAEVGEVDVAVAGLVQLALDHLARVEVVHCGAIAAVGDVFADVALGDGGVGHVGGCVEAFAEIEEVS